MEKRTSHRRSQAAETKAAPNSDPETHFLRLYQYAIMAFNRLDRNIGYFLRDALDSMDPDNAWEDATYDRKLRKVRSIVQARNELERYSEFLTLAEGCRTMRNRLVHGSWEFRPHLDKPIRYHVLSPLEESGGLTIEEFVQVTHLFEKAERAFRAIRMPGRHAGR